MPDRRHVTVIQLKGWDVGPSNQYSQPKRAAFLSLVAAFRSTQGVVFRRAWRRIVILDFGQIGLHHPEKDDLFIGREEPPEVQQAQLFRIMDEMRHERTARRRRTAH